MQAEVHAPNVEFDRDTMNGRISESNHRWFERFQSELERSSTPYLAVSFVYRPLSHRAR